MIDETDTISYHVNTFVMDDGNIMPEIHSELRDKITTVSRQMIMVQDEQVKQALIKLGWTPPKGG